MNPVRLALRRPFTVLVALIAIAAGSCLAVGRSVCEQIGLPWPAGLPKGMEVDVFPSLNLPVIYVCQPYSGMDPAQMEGYLTNYYEYHFLYISGIHHVESKNIQGTALMKLFFHPGTNMPQAMAETINYVNRSQAFMPPGTVSPFVMRFDTGSVPVGYLVLSSETRTIAEIQDLALFRVRPIFASLSGVSAPPPFGGAQRTVVVTVDPNRIQAQGISPEEIVAALSTGNTISPSGNLPLGDTFAIVPVNSVVRDVRELETIPIRAGDKPVYLRDVAHVRDFMDAPTGYALVNGRRAVYILATKRSDASTLSVIQGIRQAVPDMQAVLPPDIKVSFEFDQSPFVTRSVAGVLTESLLGSALVGIMVLLFLRNWRSAFVIVCNIPLALMAALFVLWLTGQTINVMTLGGLALAVGILVDEATVELENVHAQMALGYSVPRAVRLGNAQTAVPRLLAMLCILAVFTPAFFMRGAAQALFIPLSLAVGCAMAASYLLSSTFVPVAAVWFLHRAGPPNQPVTDRHDTVFARLRRSHERLLARLVALRWGVVAAYLAGCVAVVWVVAPRLGEEIFPAVAAGQFRLRLRAPDGTHFGKTEVIARQVLNLIEQEVGAEKIKLTLGYVGTIPSSYPINAVYQWSRGPEEALILVELVPQSGVSVAALQETLRTKLRQALPDVRLSFEPADIVNDVMSFGSPTPIEIAVTGQSLDESRRHAERIYAELITIPGLRDVQFSQSLDYPTIAVNVNREKASQLGVTPADVSRSLIAATSSTRFTARNFWSDPKSGIGYQVQIELPRRVVRAAGRVEQLTGIGDLERLPLKSATGRPLFLRDVATIERGAMPGQFDRYNMRRQVSLTANIAAIDLGTAAAQIARAITNAGDPPRGAKVEIRGQIPTLREIQSGLAAGLGLAVAAVLLLLAANFQSLRLALAAVATAPAAIAGVALTLYFTATRLNIQSFIGAIMAIGVTMANAILLITFAEDARRRGRAVPDAALIGAAGRLRAILMTSCAMIGGMLPMALAWGEAGPQNAPLGRAVVGGLSAASLATLLVLPCIYVIVQRRAVRGAISLDPDDPASLYYEPQSQPAEGLS